MPNNIMTVVEAKERITKAAREAIEKECPEIEEAIKEKALNCILKEYGFTEADDV
tara:strand:- start:412 stop:576 length:165 start_codon:yes stop_codon:yes gene_type:complete